MKNPILTLLRGRWSCRTGADSVRRAEKRALGLEELAETRSEGREDSGPVEEDKPSRTWLKLREVVIGFLYGYEMGLSFKDEEEEDEEELVMTLSLSSAI